MTLLIKIRRDLSPHPEIGQFKTQAYLLER